MDWRSKESVGAVHQLISVVRAKNDLPFEVEWRHAILHVQCIYLEDLYIK